MTSVSTHWGTAVCPHCSLPRQVKLQGAKYQIVKRCRACSHLERTRGYTGVHRALGRLRGKASEHWCDSCDGRAAQWAYLYTEPDPQRQVDERGRTYSLDLDRYVPMCKSCHRGYDAQRITHCPRGHEYTAENTLARPNSRACRTCCNAKHRAWAKKKREAAK